MSWRVEQGDCLELMRALPDASVDAIVCDPPYALTSIQKPGGLVLDPFCGSGTTGCACVLEGFRFLGMEQDAEYAEIARRRVAHWAGVARDAQREPGPEPDLFSGEAS